MAERAVDGSILAVAGTHIMPIDFYRSVMFFLFCF